jgi:glycogen debranching enzyme
VQSVAHLNDHRRAGVIDPTGTEQWLRKAAAGVLAGNWLGSSTVPSRGLYPHQWSWDSAFIALGLRHLAPERARLELRTLFDAQWADGRVPHIVFNPATPAEAYFPGPAFWQAGQTSGIVQPPVHALAVWEVHRANPDEAFLAAMYPKLTAWHDYLRTRRDFGGRGLVSIVHPWESGMDNSPAWDGPLSRVRPIDPGEFVRRDLEHGDAADRPTDDDYGRYVRLAAGYRDLGYDDSRWTAFADAFAVEDPGFNALFAAAERVMAEIATELGRPDAAAEHRAQASRITEALVSTLWDAEAGFFFPRDALLDELAGQFTCTGLLPLLLAGLPVADELLHTATGPRFGLGVALGVPSYDLTAADFDAAKYWRGPSWFNVGWLVHRGLLAQGEHTRARRLRSDLLDSAWRSDFAEYTDPLAGAGHGARAFSWTAALTVDLLSSTT